ncbi:MAG TPA: endonuclease/exonuclease/phosphatase family protein [Candidatus Saccharibacteria bacterium]|nr:endonuclease/exonuclease/phosphatase family protein [Candidatus Saccharibacteria bacterium]
MSFARKCDAILALKPDIIVLEEVSQKDIADSNAPFTHWVGSNTHKGLGVIGVTPNEYKIADNYTDDLPWFLPIEIPSLNINLLAVWAHVKSQQLRYVRVSNEAFDRYRDFLTARPSIMAGDFNSNTNWDNLHPGKSHSILVEKLSSSDINSLYHHQTNEKQGDEQTPTQYMYRKPEKGYHIDYAFMSSSLLDRSNIEIGKPEDWLQYSDHMPLIIDIIDN